MHQVVNIFLFLNIVKNHNIRGLLFLPKYKKRNVKSANLGRASRHRATCCQRHPLDIKGAINKETSPLFTKPFKETAKHFAGNTYFIGTFSILCALAPALSLFHSFAAETFSNGCTLDNSTEPAPQSPPPAPTTSHMLPHAGLQTIKRACSH